MWSLGCVIHEIATKQTAFKNDLKVLQYDQIKDDVLEIELNTSSGFLQHHVPEIIRALLHRNPRERPSAALASRIFSSYCKLFALPGAHAVCAAPSYPEFQKWQETVEKHLSEPQILCQLDLAKLFEGR